MFIGVSITIFLGCSQNNQTLSRGVSRWNWPRARCPSWTRCWSEVRDY